MVIRPATLKDLDRAVPLLLQAGEALLTKIFGKGQRQNALDFLSFAWRFGAGQYGYQNHWVAIDDSQVVGLVTCWHTGLPDDFDRLTLTCVTDYYGFEGAMEILAQNQIITENLRSPCEDELALGHLAVAPAFRRKGVAGELVWEMERYARQLGKTRLILDVEEENHPAISFYRATGFNQINRYPPFVQFSRRISG